MAPGEALETARCLRDRRLGPLFAALTAVLWVVLSPVAEADRLSDSFNGRKVLADFMVGLARHISWPDSAFTHSRSAFVICVLGPDPFEGSLAGKLGKRRIGPRPLLVKNLAMAPIPPEEQAQVQAGEPPGVQKVSGLEGCHQVFVAASLKPRIKEILEQLDNLTVLSISDMDGFTSAGGMVGVVGSGNRVAMQINRTALADSGLTVSPALLRLGR